MARDFEVVVRRFLIEAVASVWPVLARVRPELATSWPVLASFGHNLASIEPPQNFFSVFNERRAPLPEPPAGCYEFKMSKTNPTVEARVRTTTVVFFPRGSWN